MIIYEVFFIAHCRVSNISYYKTCRHFQFMTEHCKNNAIYIKMKLSLYYLVDKKIFMTFKSIISRKLPDVTFYIIRCHFIVLHFFFFLFKY